MIPTVSFLFQRYQGRATEISLNSKNITPLLSIIIYKQSYQFLKELLGCG